MSALEDINAYVAYDLFIFNNELEHTTNRERGFYEKRGNI